MKYSQITKKYVSKKTNNIDQIVSSSAIASSIVFTFNKQSTMLIIGKNSFLGTYLLVSEIPLENFFNGTFLKQNLNYLNFACLYLCKNKTKIVTRPVLRHI